MYCHRDAPQRETLRSLCLALCSLMSVIEYLDENRRFIPNKAAPLLMVGEAEMLCASFASYEKGTAYASGVPGIYICIGKKPLFSTGAPLMCRFTAAEPVITIASKMAGENVYLYCVTVTKLIEWSAVAHVRNSSETIDVSSFFGLFKVPRADLVSVATLMNTETHDLKAMIDNLISYVPFLKVFKCAVRRT